MPDDLPSRYRARLGLLNDLCAALQDAVEEILQELLHVDRVYFRVKTVSSFIEKARDPKTSPPYRDPLVEIEDQVAGRVLVFFLDDLDGVKEKLTASFNPVEITRRRPTKDEEFGYESDHLILMIPPHLKPAGWDARLDLPATFEMQVRTLYMHAWSEPQHDFAYKGPEELPQSIRRELSWVAASSWGADQAMSRVFKWQLEERGGGA